MITHRGKPELPTFWLGKSIIMEIFFQCSYDPIHRAAQPSFELHLQRVLPGHCLSQSLATWRPKMPQMHTLSAFSCSFAAATAARAQGLPPLKPLVSCLWRTTPSLSARRKQPKPKKTSRTSPKPSTARVIAILIHQNRASLRRQIRLEYLHKKTAKLNMQ